MLQHLHQMVCVEHLPQPFCLGQMHHLCCVEQTPEHLKTETAEESFNPDGLAQRSIKLLKDTFPDIEVCYTLPAYLLCLQACTH